MTCPLVGSTLNAYFNNIDKNNNNNNNRKEIRKEKERKKEDINQSIISRVASFDKVCEIRKEKKKRAKEEKKTVLLYAPHGISKSPSQNLPRTCSSSP